MTGIAKLDGLMKIWLNAQRPMTDTLRWGNYPDYGQTLVEHNNSVGLVGRYVISHLEGECEFDYKVLTDAFMIHDHGEPLTGGDQHSGNRTPEKEALEWEAVCGMIEALPEPLRSDWFTAFNLQYCIKTPNEFWPSEMILAQESLLGVYATEAIIFDFVERFDYVLSAIEGNRRQITNTEGAMLEHVLRNQVHKLDGLVKELPALKTIWSAELVKDLYSSII